MPVKGTVLHIFRSYHIHRGVLLIFIVGLLYACVPPSLNDNQKTIYVAANKVNCVNGEGRECLLIKDNPEDDWTIFYGSIDGFEYQPGFEYELLIRSQVLDEPGEGGPMLKIELVEILGSIPHRDDGTTTSQSEAGPGELDWQKLENITFSPAGLDGEEVQLRNGTASGLPGGMEANLAPYRVYGDLNGDGRADAALIITLGGGDGWPSHHLLGVVNDGGFARALPSVELGQAEFIRLMEIENGLINVTLDEYTADDPVCCPSIQRQMSFSIGGEGLVLEKEEESEAVTNPSQFDTVIERIDLQSEENEIFIDGEIQFNGIDHYMLRGLAGQILTVNLSSLHDTVLLSIIGEEYGEVLSSVEDELTAWSGELPNTQDYIIRAVSVGGETDYQLTLGISGEGGRTSMIPPEPYLIPEEEGAVEVRAGPGLGFRVIGQLDKGEAIRITGKNLGVTEETRWWRACCFDGGEGWIRDDNGEVVGDTESLTIPETSSLGTPEPLSPDSASILNTEKVLYLTFEGGPPEKDGMSRLLEALEEYQAQAAFFTTGDKSQEYQELLENYGDIRHSLGSHTVRYFTLSDSGRSAFFEEAEATAQSIGGRAGKCLRPPYSTLDSYTRASAAEKGYQVVLWDINSRDWQQDDAVQVAGEVAEKVFPGAVILMHDLDDESSSTVEALEILLPQLAEQGYRFVTACE